MNLVIDIGNTKVKIAVFDKQSLIKKASLSNLSLNKVSDWLNAYPIINIILSTVKKQPDKLIQYLSSTHTVINLNHKTPLPVTIEYSTPETLGKDRIAAVVGGNELFPNENILVIDIGTAITYDLIDANNRYLGGQISPGRSIRFKALHTFTDQLPLISRSGNWPEIGNSTESSIQCGVQVGILHEINGFVSQYEKKYNPLRVIVTGGDVNLFVSRLKNQIFANPNLVLSGLNKILNYNVESNN
jgi:type III pantothenate kinase